MRRSALISCLLALFAFAPSAVAQTAPWLPEPAPAAVDRTPIRERGPSPYYYRADVPNDWFFLRVAPGVSVHTSPAMPVAAGFVLDISGQAIVGPRGETRRMYAWTELGYRLVTSPGPYEGLVDVGVGIAVGPNARSYNEQQVAIGLIPAFVVGTAMDRLALGFRTTLEWRAFEAPFALGLAFSHQALFTSQGTVQDVVFSVTLGLCAERRRAEASHVAP